MDTEQKKITQKKEFTGRVVSVLPGHTAVISVTHMTRTPIYKKLVKRSKHFTVDTGSHQLKNGETVRISQCRPISKTKHFVVLERISL